LDALVESKGQDENTVRERAVELAKLLVTTNEDNETAIELLDSIRSRDFAYRPNALILFRKIYGDSNLKRTKAIEDELNTNWFDSLEWLEERSRRIQAPTEWRAYRIRNSKDP
jgi:hypothetical protein